MFHVYNKNRYCEILSVLVSFPVNSPFFLPTDIAVYITEQTVESEKYTNALENKDYLVNKCTEMEKRHEYLWSCIMDLARHVRSRYLLLECWKDDCMRNLLFNIWVYYHQLEEKKGKSILLHLSPFDVLKTSEQRIHHIIYGNLIKILNIQKKHKRYLNRNKERLYENNKCRDRYLGIQMKDLDALKAYDEEFQNDIEEHCDLLKIYMEFINSNSSPKVYIPDLSGIEIP